MKSTGITTIIDLRTKEEKEKKPSGLAGQEDFDYYDIQVVEGSRIPESVEAVPDSYYKIAHATGIAEVFKTIAMAKSGVMIICSAGKDRTGVVAALILWLCGIRKSDIVYDYLRTKENYKTRFKDIHEKLPDLDMNIVIPNENNMYKLFEMLEEKYGSATEYFEAIGIEDELQEKIKVKLVLNR